MDDVGFLLARASGLVVRATNDALRDDGLRVRQYSVLTLACDAAEGISQRDLAAVLGLDPSQVVALVDELVETGWVERRPSRDDRRTKLIASTAAGKRVRRTAAAHANAGVSRALADLAAEEREVLRDLLARIVVDTG